MKTRSQVYSAFVVGSGVVFVSLGLLPWHDFYLGIILFLCGIVAGNDK